MWFSIQNETKYRNRPPIAAMTANTIRNTKKSSNANITRTTNPIRHIGTNAIAAPIPPSGSGESLQLKPDTVTDNIVAYYSPITSSSYAVLDSGYKYMYDRFNQQFRYVPMNGDIAGTCARNDMNAHIPSMHIQQTEAFYMCVLRY